LGLGLLAASGGLVLRPASCRRTSKRQKKWGHQLAYELLLSKPQVV